MNSPVSKEDQYEILVGLQEIALTNNEETRNSLVRKVINKLKQLKVLGD
jgi:hypothetical protein